MTGSAPGAASRATPAAGRAPRSHPEAGVSAIIEAMTTPTVVLQLGAAQVGLDAYNNRVFVGRDPAASQLAHLEAGLSRRHAEVWLTQGNVWIRDLGSANGTWVNGQAIGGSPVVLQPGMQVYLGSVPLAVRWTSGGAIAAAPAAPAFAAQVQHHQQQVAQAAAAAPAPLASQPLPKDYSYRRQDANGNGVVLLALKQDTAWSGQKLHGFVEFTALDNETVASITVELIEKHADGPGKGHVWDRVLVRQGPWKALHNDVLPLPFEIDVPSGVAPSAREVHWYLHAVVDINWASDVDVELPLTMRNHDLERIRDALGALDYRFSEWRSRAHAQRFDARFQPPAQHRGRINGVDVGVEYLGATVKLALQIDKKGRDREEAVAIDLAQLRGSPVEVLTATLQKIIDDAMR